MIDWVSVKDELPDGDKYVLVYYSDSPTKPINVGWYSTLCKMWDVGYLKSGNVTHWMPLPKFPEEK